MALMEGNQSTTSKETRPAIVDADSFLLTRGNPATGTLVASTAYAASLVIKATPGTLISVSGYNSKASAQFIQLHDAASLPADTAVPEMTFTVPATSNFSFDIPLTGMPFAIGIVVANSSTGPTLTVGSADVYFTAVRI